MKQINWILIFFLLLIVGCSPTTPNLDEGGLSQTIEKVNWKPVKSDPNIVDDGEQPGWTKLKEKCDKLINNKQDAKICLERYEKAIMENYWRKRGDNRTVNVTIDIENIKRDKIIVKHEKKDDDSKPILSREPTIEPYKIEVFKKHNIRAVDWEGNIYQYQTWA